MSKRYIIIFLLFIAACAVVIKPIPSGVIELEAQSLPITKIASWIANPVGEGVFSYTFQLDNESPKTILSTQPLETSFTITTQGAHKLSIIANNTWGSSTPSILNVNVTIPSTPGGLAIKP